MRHPPPLVFGPAYLDRVVRVPRRLVDPGLGGPLDVSVDGRIEPGGDLVIQDDRAALHLSPPDDWPGPFGTVRLGRTIFPEGQPERLDLPMAAWLDDLGGMGAGFAAAMGGRLVSALGAEDDPWSRAIEALLAARGIDHRPVRVADRGADWTLLLSSGEFGDKLPIGFRGCHAALSEAPTELAQIPHELLLVAALPNAIAADAFRRSRASIRVFAPSMRNAIDAETPLGGLAGSFHVLVCNRQEWENTAGREDLEDHLSLLSVTDGPLGALLFFHDQAGSFRSVAVPVFPREAPPRDTNRAGEAFASTLLKTLIGTGWRGERRIDAELVGEAGRRASAAAALVLDRETFGFSSGAEVDGALAEGIVRSAPGGGMGKPGARA